MEHIWVEGCMTHIPLTPCNQSPSHLSYILGFKRVKVDCSMIRFGRSNSLAHSSTSIGKLFDPSKIATLRDMMIDEDGFSIGVDSEYELVDGEREIISWQFAFVLEDKVYELVVFPLGNKLLNFENMISWIIETFGVWGKFGRVGDLGYNFSAVRTWKIALGGKKKYKMVDTFSEALSQSCPEYSEALSRYGVRKAETERAFAKALEYGLSIVVSTVPNKLKGFDELTKIFRAANNLIILGSPEDQNMIRIPNIRNYKPSIDMGFIVSRQGARKVRMPRA